MIIMRNMEEGESIPEIYNRLEARYLREKHQSYDLQLESARLNMLFRPGNGADDEAKLIVAEIIEKLIFHHCRITEGASDPKAPLYRSKLIAKDKCPQYEMKDIPVKMQQLLIRFVDEVIDNSQ
jgi:hypothetical protein